MALITGLVGLLGRFAGRFANATLGWATTLLFGKVPQRKQNLLLIIVFAALGWVAAVVGIIWPDVGSLLIAAVPLPEFVDEAWVRLAMLAAAVLLPLVVGTVALFIADKDQRPGGAGLLKMVLRGYPFTLVLVLTVIVLAGVGTLRKLRSLSRRWQDAHVPLIVKPGGYERVLADVHDVLGRAGMELDVRSAPAAVSAPARLLDAVAGRGLGSLVPDQLMLLSSTELEILVYPSDLAISGTREAVARARAAVVDKLTESPTYQTTTAEAQAIEDEIEQIARPEHSPAPGVDEARIAEIGRKLARLVVPFEEWETLYRQKLQVERNALAARDAPDKRQTGHRFGRPAPRDVALALFVAGLLALDVLLLAGRRRSPKWAERHTTRAASKR
jgi:hypothetical protein